MEHNMKKLIFILSIAMVTVTADVCAATRNPFTLHYKNQIAFNVGQGVDSGFIVPPPTRFVPFYFAHLQYSQPSTFFGVPARQSLNIAQTLGFGNKYGWRWRKYTIPMVLMSEDILLADHDKFYFAGGAGVGLQAQENERIGSKLLFQFKLTAGWHINNKWGMELFVLHFSNANTAPENNSYAFYGLGVTYNF
jgi:hypothetical protein